MSVNTPGSDALAQTIGSLITFLGGFGAVVDRFNKQLSKIKTVYAQVGKLGWPYRVLSSGPAHAYWWGFFFVYFASAYILVQGLLELAGKRPLSDLPSGLDLTLFVFASAALLGLLAYLEIWTRVGLAVFRRFGQLRFHPGSINAGWQVGGTDGIKAMNVSDANCEAMGMAILDRICGQWDPPGEMAPAPAVASQAILANYIFFGCVIEHYVHRLFLPRAQLNSMWRYLAWVARATDTPLNPPRIVDIVGVRHQSYFETLLAVGSAHPGAQEGNLPVAAQIADGVNKAAAWLASKHAGSATELSESFLHRTASPNAVWENLGSVEPFRSSTDLRSLFLKLAMRMQVWPQMRPGAFLFPYYSGLPVLFLNAGCLVVAYGIQRIDPDEGWRALVASIEERIIDAAYRQFSMRSGEEVVDDLSQRFFHDLPENVDKWKFTDFMDLWLFDHTRNNCTVQTAAVAPVACSLRRGADGCYCIGRPGRWYRKGESFELKT